MMMLNPRQDPKGSRYVHTQAITPTSPPVIVAFESSAAHVPLNTGGAGGVSHQLPFLLGFPVRASCLLLPHLPQVSCSLYDRFLFLRRSHQRGMTRTLREHATWAGWEGIAEGHPWLAESSRSRFPKRQTSGTPSSGPFWGDRSHRLIESAVLGSPAGPQYTQKHEPRLPPCARLPAHRARERLPQRVITPISSACACVWQCGRGGTCLSFVPKLFIAFVLRLSFRAK